MGIGSITWEWGVRCGNRACYVGMGNVTWE